MEKIEFDSVESVNLFVNEGHYLPVGTDFRIGKNPNLFTIIAKVGSGCITIAPRLRALDEPKEDYGFVADAKKAMEERDARKPKSIPKNIMTAFGRRKVNIYG